MRYRREQTVRVKLGMPWHGLQMQTLFLSSCTELTNQPMTLWLQNCSLRRTLLTSLQSPPVLEVLKCLAKTVLFWEPKQPTAVGSHLALWYLEPPGVNYERLLCVYVPPHLCCHTPLSVPQLEGSWESTWQGSLLQEGGSGPTGHHHWRRALNILYNCHI